MLLSYFVFRDGMKNLLQIVKKLMVLGKRHRLEIAHARRFLALIELPDRPGRKTGESD